MGYRAIEEQDPPKPHQVEHTIPPEHRPPQLGEIGEVGLITLLRRFRRAHGDAKLLEITGREGITVSGKTLTTDNLDQLLK